MKKMTVEELQVLITANTKDFNAKIDKANKRLGSLEQQATRTGAGVGKLFTGIKTTAAVAAIQKVVSEVKKLTDAYAENEAAQMGLSSILTAQGKDLNAAKAWLKSYTKDGLIPMMDAYTAYKSLAAAGYSDEQTQSILTNLKDSAAFNRQGSMTMGEAIKSAAEGIKNENSILVDNAGVTKNLSVIWDEYAASIGKTAATLTDAEKRIATTQGIMRETAFQTGDAAKYSNTLAGAQAALKAQTKMLSSALGSMFAPALQQCIPQVTAVLERLTALAEKAGQVMAILFGTSSATSRTSSNTAKLANSTQQVSTNLGSAAKKAAAKAGNALRAIYAAAKSLIAAAAAGGSVVLALLVLICVIGLLVASPFGILFANEPADSTTVALSPAIAQINEEYAGKLEELQAGDYDQIIIDGAPPDWREVVAVFAVKTAGTNDGVDVVTLDAGRVERLREVFWDMVSLSSEAETIDHPDDGEDDSWTETILTISITGKTVDEMREHYAFTDEQNDMLDDLLENLDLLGGAIGNLNVTEADAKELLASLPADLSAERWEIIETACQLVGKVNYFWGGKSLTIGWDSRWGTTMQVTAAGSSSSGTYRPYGMDCSGYVDWVFYNATGGAYIIGHGGGASAQHTYCTTISWDARRSGILPRGLPCGHRRRQG